MICGRTYDNVAAGRRVPQRVRDQILKNLRHPQLVTNRRGECRCDISIERNVRLRRNISHAVNGFVDALPDRDLLPRDQEFVGIREAQVSKIIDDPFESPCLLTNAS